MYLTLLPHTTDSARFAKLTDVEEVLPSLANHHCDFNKKYRGRSLVDVALYEHQPGSIMSAIIRCTSIQWTPEQLSQLFFKNYTEFQGVISKSDFDLSLLKMSTVVAAFMKNPSDTRRDIIMNQKDLAWDELGLTIAHYVALSSAIGDQSNADEFTGKISVDNKSARWRTQGYNSGSSLPFKILFEHVTFKPRFWSSTVPQTTFQPESGFSFGLPTPSQPFSFGTTPTPPQELSSFSFGSSPVPQETVQPLFGGFSFGMPSVTSPFSFGFVQTNTDSTPPFTVDTNFVSPQVTSNQLIEDFFTRHKDALNSSSMLGETPLLVLCKVALPQKIKLEGVRHLLKVSGVDVNRADKNGWTPLHAALLSLEFDIAKMLLEHGANINAQDGFGITPLMAWFYGYNYRGRAIELNYYEDTTFLLQQKDIDFILADAQFNRSVIHLMACLAPPSLLDLVLKSGVSHVVLEARDIEGFTPLHHAVMFCNYDMMTYLIKKGANVNAQSYALKLTPLMIFFAIHNCVQSPHLHWLEHCNTIMLGRFIASELPNSKESHKYFTFLEPGWIAQSRKLPTFSYAADNMHESHKDWKFLATDKTDLTLADRFGNTLLHLAVKRHLMFDHENGELWSELDFLWNHRNAKGETPFHLLARDTEMNKQIAKHFVLFRELIRTGKIDLFIEDNKGSYGLELLLTTVPLSVEQKQELVALSKKDSNQVRTSLPKKCSQRSLLHAILQRAQISIHLVRSIITQFSHEVNAQDDDGNTPLMALLLRYYNDFSRSQQQAIRAQQGFDPDQLVNVDEDPSKIFPFVEYLMTRPGADLNIQNNEGDTALHIVCRHFHVGALEAVWCQFNSFEQAAKYCLVAFELIAGGAQVTIKNNAGETAVDYAPKLMYHYQAVYPRIKDYKTQLQTNQSV